jgi:hypothetical protein
MQGSLPELVDADWASFDPWRVRPVKHKLADHRLLKIDSLIELGRRLEALGRVRTHSSEAYAGTAFNHAPMLYPNGRSTVETLSDVAAAKAWTSLLNVQTDDIYRTLVDEVLDDVKPQVDLDDPGMLYRAGWIFVTSPRTITPFHMDKEHNFILQIQGKKRLYVWEPDDIVTLSEEARDLFHFNHSRDLVVWREELRARAHVFELEPGMGAYMPSTSPHLVENLDGPSITASFTYYTDATRRNARLHTLHHRLRTRGLKPSPVGARPMLDSVANAGCLLADSLKRAVDRTRGRETLSDSVRYAHPTLA